MYRPTLTEVVETYRSGWRARAEELRRTAPAAARRRLAFEFLGHGLALLADPEVRWGHGLRRARPFVDFLTMIPRSAHREAPITPDVAPPSSGVVAGERTHGWHINLHTESVCEAWSTRHLHGRDHDGVALRRHLARETAEKMLLIDRMIDLRDLLSQPKAG